MQQSYDMIPCQYKSRKMTHSTICYLYSRTGITTHLQLLLSQFAVEVVTTTPWGKSTALHKIRCKMLLEENTLAHMGNLIKSTFCCIAGFYGVLEVYTQIGLNVLAFEMLFMNVNFSNFQRFEMRRKSHAK